MKKNIAIAGAGLVGSLLAIYLLRRGYHVTIFERRPDMRKNQAGAGRSINLALSTRGLHALEEVGLSDDLRAVAIPMHGRMVHDRQGNTNLQPYGKQGQFINSISRSNLNIVLMNKAEALGAVFHFEQRVTHIDTERSSITTASPENHQATYRFDGVVGADGAYSAVRLGLQLTDRFDFSQTYIEHGYKELHIPAGAGHQFTLEKHALHIWPRESFMMIALPNPDGSFTGTLFFPFEGTTSFASLTTDNAIRNFLAETFPDVVRLMPEALADFNHNPTGSLVTVRCYPWVRHNTLLIGDAAHAIVPFYGQGMNAGFEDCSVLNQLLQRHHDHWDTALQEFQLRRKPDTDAIAQLALDNFIEMRDLVADEKFVLRKKIEARLHELYPDKWIPLYSMVTFHENIRYADALHTGRKQKEIMDDILAQPNIATTWTSLNFEQLANRLHHP